MKKWSIPALILIVIGILLAVYTGLQGRNANTTKVDAPADAVTVEGSAQGMNGPVTVSVTLTKDKIYDLHITKQQETQGIGSNAIEQIPPIILADNTISFDAVSGATITSEAIRSALIEAIKSAGFDPAAFQNAVSEKKQEDDQAMDTDVVTYADANDEFAAVSAVIRDTLQAGRKTGRQLEPAKPYRTLPVQRMLPREAFFASRQAVPFEAAAGRICGESISFYPPGIPLIMPGEEIDSSLIRYCRQMQARKLNVSGPRDSLLQTIEVIGP